MFSGLGSLDLNSTFGQLSSTFSLDNLQNDEKKTDSTAVAAPAPVAAKKSSSESMSKDGANSAEVESLRSMLVLKDTELTSLMEVFQENSQLLQVEKTRNDELTALLQVSETKLSELTDSFELKDRKNIEQIRVLEKKLSDEYEARDVADQEHQDKYNGLVLELQSVRQSVAASASSSTASAASTTESADAEQLTKLSSQVSALELSLSQSKSKTESLEKQLSKTKTSLSEYQEKLAAAEKAAAELETSKAATKKELQTALDAAQQSLIQEKSHSSSLSEQLASLKQSLEAGKKSLADSQSGNQQQSTRLADLEKQIQALTSELEKSRRDLSEVNADSQQNLSMITQQADAVELLTSEKQALQSQLSAAEGRIAALTQEVNLVRTSSHSSSDQAEDLQRRLSNKETQCSELEAKVQQLTDKIKEVMQRFIESKGKVTATEQAAEQRIAEMAKLSQTKESEVISLRLKLENIERSSSDHKVRTGELAERYGEAQREIARSHEQVKELTHRVEQRESDVAQLRESVAQLSEEGERLRNQLKEQQEASQSSGSHHSQQVEALKAQREVEEQRHLTEVAELKLEITGLQGRLKVDTESADVLDGYKKRAQVALKKANAAAATLQEENNRLTASIEDANGRVADMEAAVRSHEEAEEKLEKRIKELQSELEEQKKSLSQSQEALSEAQSRPVEKVEIFSDNLNDVIQELQHQLGEAKQVIADLQARNHSLEAAHSTVLAQQQQQEQQKGGASSVIEASSAAPFPVVRSTPVLTTSWARSAARPVDKALSTNVHHHATAGSDLLSDRDTNESPLEGQSQSGSLLFVAELQSQLEVVKKELSLRGIDIEAAHQELQCEREEKKKLKNRIEELMAYLDRTKKLQEGPDSAVNMEYLKNCVLKFMASTQPSEKKRLFPVIATILKLTQAEKDSIIGALNEMDDKQDGEINTFGAIGSIAESFWGYGATAILGTASTVPVSSSGGSSLSLASSSGTVGKGSSSGTKK